MTSNLTSGGHRLMMARPRDFQNTKAFDWVNDKSEADLMTEQMSEWDLALVKHKIRDDPREGIKEAEKAIKDIDEAIKDAYDPMASKTMDELDELEDDEDDEILRVYRAKRIAEMQAAKASAKFGEVYHIREDEYRREVSELASEKNDVWVVVHLFKDSKTACVRLNTAFDKVAKRFPATKFVKIFSTDANNAYPDDRLPTVLVYHKGGIAQQYFGLDEWGGPSVTGQHVEWQLSKLGAIQGSKLYKSPFEVSKLSESDEEDEDDY